MSKIFASEFPGLTDCVIEEIEAEVAERLDQRCESATLRDLRDAETVARMKQLRESQHEGPFKRDYDFPDTHDRALGVWRRDVCRPIVCGIVERMPRVAFEFAIADGTRAFRWKQDQDRVDRSPAFSRELALSWLFDTATDAVEMLALCAPTTTLGPFGTHERALAQAVAHVRTRVMSEDSAIKAGAHWELFAVLNAVIAEVFQVVDEYWSLPLFATEGFEDVAILAATGVITFNEDREAWKRWWP